MTATGKGFYLISLMATAAGMGCYMELRPSEPGGVSMYYPASLPDGGDDGDGGDPLFESLLAWRSEIMALVDAADRGPV